MSFESTRKVRVGDPWTSTKAPTPEAEEAPSETALTPATSSAGAGRAAPRLLQGLFEGYSEGSSAQVQARSATDRGFDGDGERPARVDRDQEVSDVQDLIYGYQNQLIPTTWGCIGLEMKRLVDVDKRRREIGFFHFIDRWRLSSERDEIIEGLTGGSTDYFGSLLFNYLTVARLERKLELLKAGKEAPKDERSIVVPGDAIAGIKNKVWKAFCEAHGADYEDLHRYVQKWQPPAR